MKIVVITTEPLREYPPIITMMEVLSKTDNEIICITLSKDEVLAGINNVTNKYLTEKPVNYSGRYVSPRLVASAAFRLDNLIKKHYASKIPSVFSKELNEADVVWVAHENTFVYGGKKLADTLPPYVYSVYELQLKLGKNAPIYEYSAVKAKALVVPEYFRAHIVRSIYQRDVLPFVIPNKPYYHPRTKEMQISDREIAEKIAAIKKSGRKPIMYMGIISKERPLEAVIETVYKMRDKYEFVVLGSRTRYLDELTEKYGNEFTYLGCVEPPHHLEIASHAHIAYVCYVPNNKSINAVFCAPNKVYEFAGFGVPMLCNDVPGLKYTVEDNKMGVCVSNVNEESLKNAILAIEAGYGDMSAAAESYYDGEDPNDMYLKVLNEQKKQI